MSIRFACSRSEFRPCISLLIFCLFDLSNIDSGVLKSPTIIVWESKSLCKSLRTYVSGCSCVGSIYAQDRQLFLLYRSFYHYVMAFFVSFDLCCFNVYFIRGENCNLFFLFICLFLLSIWLTNLSPSLCFDSLCILASKMGLDAAHRWVLAFYPICQPVSSDWCIQPIYIQG